MRNGACESVEFPHGHNIKLSTMRVRHEPIKLGALFLCAGDSGIDVFTRHLPAAALAVFAKLPRLHGHILAVADSADTSIERGLHRVSFRAAGRAFSRARLAIASMSPVNRGRARSRIRLPRIAR